MLYVVAALGGILVGFVLRMIQTSIYAAKHSSSIGTLNVVKVGDDRADILLELYDSPEKLSQGRAIVDIVRSRR